jgi:transposase
VAVEVFDGNTADPKTFSAQIAKVKQRFGFKLQTRAHVPFASVRLAA